MKNQRGPVTLKGEAQNLFTKGGIGGYWNDLYQDVAHVRDYHFVKRLKLCAELVLSKSQPESKILDLGCGAGVLSERLLAAGRRVTAADMAPDMLEFARKRLARFPDDRYEVLRAECEELPFGDGAFDVVACIGVFGYVDDVDSAIAEIRRVLKPGGTLVMSIRNYENLRIFDLFNYLKAPFSFAVRRLRPPSKVALTDGDDGGPAAAWPPRTTQHGIAIFDRPKRVIELFERRGFRCEGFFGTGYGPVTFKGESLVPNSVAKAMSAGIERGCQALSIEDKSKWFADISVYILTRAPDVPPDDSTH